MTHALTKARQAKARMEAEGVKVSAKNPKKRHQERDTRKTAIDAMCFHCVGGESGYMADIRSCTAGPDSEVPCPLYAWRPYK